MKSTKTAIAVLLLSVAGIGNAIADHRHHGQVGVYIGPYWGPGFYGPSPYYYPPGYYPPYYPPVVVDRGPPVYIEQQAPAPAAPPPVASTPAPQTTYWYFCDAAKGYYPYVKECPGGWVKVLPQPPDPR